MSHRDLKADLLCLSLDKKIEIRDFLNDDISKSHAEEAPDKLTVLGVWETFTDDEKSIIMSHVCGEYEFDINMKSKDGIIGKALAAQARHIRQRASEYIRVTGLARDSKQIINMMKEAEILEKESYRLMDKELRDVCKWKGRELAAKKRAEAKGDKKDE